MDNHISPLGAPAPNRYISGSWPLVLLERMAYWVKQLHIEGSKKILDIGCGEGALLHKLEYFGIGVDLNISRLMLAKEKELDVLMADGTNLPFQDEQFNTVVSMEVLEHVPDMALMMKDVHRVLMPGGTWVVSVPSVTLRSKYEMWREKRPYYCDENEHYREFSPVSPHGFEHRFMLLSEFKAMFKSAGFEVTRQDGVRYLLPQWFLRVPILHKLIESPAADRFWSAIPWFRSYPYWTILVLKKVHK